MINNSVSFGKNTGSSGGVLSSVASSALNVGVTAGVGAGIGAGIGKLASLTPCKIKPQDLNFQFEDMFVSAIKNRETPSYLKGAGGDVIDIVKQGKEVSKKINMATQNVNKYASLSQFVNALPDEEIKNADFQSGIKKIIKGKMPEGGFSKKEILEKLAIKGEKASKFINDSCEKLTQTSNEFATKAASNENLKELAEKGAKHLRAKTIVGTAVAIGVVGALFLNILKTFGVIKPKRKNAQAQALSQQDMNALASQIQQAQSQALPSQM